MGEVALANRVALRSVGRGGTYRVQWPACGREVPPRRAARCGRGEWKGSAFVAAVIVASDRSPFDRLRASGRHLPLVVSLCTNREHG